MSVADHSGEAKDLRAPNASRYAWLFAQPLRPASFYAPPMGPGKPQRAAKDASRSATGRAKPSGRQNRHGADCATMLMTDDTTLSQLVGHNIRLARTAAGYSQQILGRKVGQDRREIIRWEKGERLCSEPNLHKVAAATDKPFLWFFQEHDE